MTTYHIDTSVVVDVANGTIPLSAFSPDMQEQILNEIEDKYGYEAVAAVVAHSGESHDAKH